MTIPVAEEMEHADHAGLAAGRELVIRTRNTEYRFLVIDPVSRLGVLTGGVYEDDPQEAVLASVVGEGGPRGGGEVEPSVGSRACFHLFVEGRRKTLMTSTISELRTAPSEIMLR
jgi:hypothetical protein